MSPTQSIPHDREPVDVVREQVDEAKRAAIEAIEAEEWICSDGHSHPRPETFTHRRLGEEVERRNPGNSWSSSVISLAIWALRDDGVLDQDIRWRLSVHG